MKKIGASPYCTLLHANAVDDAVELHKKLISRLDSLEHIIGEIGALWGLTPVREQ